MVDREPDDPVEALAWSVVALRPALRTIGPQLEHQSIVIGVLADAATCENVSSRVDGYGAHRAEGPAACTAVPGAPDQFAPRIQLDHGEGDAGFGSRNRTPEVDVAHAVDSDGARTVDTATIETNHLRRSGDGRARRRPGGDAQDRAESQGSGSDGSPDC